MTDEAVGEAPSYLGDGLYFEFDGWQIRLFTLGDHNVFLEPQVYKALRKQMSCLPEKIRKLFGEE